MVAEGVNVGKAAKEYRDNGWNVLPLKPKEKVPLEKWERFQKDRVTEDKLDQWSKTYFSKGANIGIVTGQISGLVVLDIDSAEGEEEIKKYWKGKTLTVKTSKGRHLYFKHPGGVIRNSVNKIFKGVDVRADGGYVVAPPSVHESGHQYSWVDENTTVADLPKALLEIITKGEHKPPVAASEGTTDVYEGGRNNKVTSLVGKLLHDKCPVDDVMKKAKDFNKEHCKPPLPEEDIGKIVKSIQGREASKSVRVVKPSDQIDFETLSYRDFVRRYSQEEINWVIDGWLPQASIGLCVAPPANHKTWMLLNLALAVSTGRPFLGHYPVNETGGVLFIQQEDPFPLLLERIGTMFNLDEQTEEAKINGDIEYALDCRFPEDLPIRFLTTRDFHFQKNLAIKWLEEEIATFKPALVILDPLYSAVSTEKYMSESVQNMHICKKLRDRYRCSLILAHHTTKSGESSGNRTDIWGSQFVNAFLEFGWRITKGDAENVQKVVRHSKFRGNEETLQLTFNITDYSFKVDVRDATKGSTTDRVKEAILSGEHRNQESIRRAVGCSKRDIGPALDALGAFKGENGYEMPEKH